MSPNAVFVGQGTKILAGVRTEMSADSKRLQTAETDTETDILTEILADTDTETDIFVSDVKCLMFVVSPLLS
jgi:hypothetical protein